MMESAVTDDRVKGQRKAKTITQIRPDDQDKGQRKA